MTTTEKPKFDIYQTITDQIIEALESGVCPWRCPWQKIGGVARNFNGRPYRGINSILLAMKSMAKGWTHPVFLTYRQAKELGGQVRKGEKSTLVVFWKQIIPKKYKAHPETCPKKDILWMVRHYNVFNHSQIDGLPALDVPEIVEFDHSPIEECERLLAEMPVSADIRHGGDRAFYRPSQDFIQMPEIKQFETVENYYATLYHELGHWSGAPSRLDRSEDKGGGFGSSGYAREELTAEMTSAFLCRRTGIAPAILENSAAYIDNWLQVLKTDKRLVVAAASKAQKAADYIAPAQELEPV